jgi:hypothetical protein
MTTMRLSNPVSLNGQSGPPNAPTPKSLSLAIAIGVAHRTRPNAAMWRKIRIAARFRDWVRAKIPGESEARLAAHAQAKSAKDAPHPPDER